MRIIFFGSDRWFSEPVLTAVVKARHEILMVVTKGEMRNEFNGLIKLNKLKTRVVEVKNQIDISRQRLVSLLRSDLAAARSDLLTPEAIVLASFGPPFLAAEVLNWPKYGCLNVHASLLPRWRGASPVFASLREGDKETGVSIMRMTEKIDRGPILGQRKIMIARPGLPKGAKGSDLGSGERSDPFDTRETLTKKLGKLGGELIVETLKKLETGQISEVRQPEKSPTPYTRRLTKESGRIDWRFRPGETSPERSRRIERFIRAALPWPSAMSNVKFKIKNEEWQTIQNVKILKVHLERIQNSEFPARQSLALQAPAGGKIQNYLIIDEVQLAGKNPISWKQFLAGHPGAELG